MSEVSLRVHCPSEHALPFCSVSVEVCALTFATRPSTTVFGGFWSVTVTEMPMSAVAMVVGGRIRRLCDTCPGRADVRRERIAAGRESEGACGPFRTLHISRVRLP